MIRVVTPRLSWLGEGIQLLLVQGYTVHVPQSGATSEMRRKHNTDEHTTKSIAVRVAYPGLSTSATAAVRVTPSRAP